MFDIYSIPSSPYQLNGLLWKQKKKEKHPFYPLSKKKTPQLKAFEIKNRIRSILDDSSKDMTERDVYAYKKNDILGF